MGRHRAHPQRIRDRGAQRLVPATLGIALLLLGAGILASISAYHQRSDHAAARLTRQAEHAASSATVVRNGVIACTAPPPSKATTPGAARMLLTAPTLGLTAPVTQGTGAASLDVGVGHVATSSWPDQGGADVLAAHDVTFFSRIDQLHPGDTLTLTAPCRHWTYRVTAGNVVHAGTAVTRTTEPTLVLVTCWPTNALFYTDQRYLVTAALVSAASTTGEPRLTHAPELPAIAPTLPAELQRVDLSVDALSVPLGQLHLSPGFDLAWRQSDRPLRASNAATHLFDAALLSLREGRPDWWHVLAPDVPITDAGPLRTNPYPPFSTPLEVTVTGDHTTVTAVSLDTVIQAGPVPYQLHLTLTSHHDFLSLTAWQMRPL